MSRRIWALLFRPFVCLVEEGTQALLTDQVKREGKREEKKMKEKEEKNPTL